MSTWVCKDVCVFIECSILTTFLITFLSCQYQTQLQISWSDIMGNILIPCTIVKSSDLKIKIQSFVCQCQEAKASFILSKKVVEELKAILGARDQKAARTFQVSFNRELIVTCEPMNIYWSSSFGMVWQQQLTNNYWWNRNVTWTRNTVLLLPQWLQLHRSILRAHQPSATIVNWQTWKHLASHLQ